MANQIRFPGGPEGGLAILQCFNADRLCVAGNRLQKSRVIHSYAFLRGLHEEDSQAPHI